MGQSESNDSLFNCCEPETDMNGGLKSNNEYSIPEKYIINDFSVYHYNRTVNESLNAVVQEFYKAGTNEIYVVKSINYNNKEEFEHTYRQAFSLYKCQFKHVLEFKGYYDKRRQSPKGDLQGTFCIFTENMTGSLQSEITNRVLQGVPFDYRELYYLFCSTIDALKFIHSKGINHLNLKATNILLRKTNPSGSGGLKWDVLPDIKLSDILHQKLNSEIKRSEAIYVSPEAKNYLSGDPNVTINFEKTDIYSLGIVLLQSLVLQDLKSEKIDEEFIQNLLREQPEQFQGFSNILTKMLSQNPEDRGTFNELADNIRAINF